MKLPKFLNTIAIVVLILLNAVFATAALAANSGFSPQTRVGFTVGDQWEPAIAADGSSHVYILYPQYGSVPACPSCALPTMVLAVSNDNGRSWRSPRPISPTTSGQFDAQIVVDPLDRRTVYASWLQNNKNDTIVAKSVDFGQTWTVVVADRTRAGVDKPILVVLGKDVYVGYNHAKRVWVSSSHDGGNTFTSANVSSNPRLGWSLAGGAAIDQAGNVYFSWAGFTQSGGAKGPVNLYISKSSDAGRTWTTTLLDVSGSPPGCSAFQCGWAYLGAQITMTADSSGMLYALWNAGAARAGNERIYFASSTTAGATWSPKQDVSLAPIDVEHSFPAIVAGSAGDVRIAWMDSRRSPLWNTYYRSSTNGGATWSSETQISTYVPGYKYIQSKGFSFPFGDYFEMDIDSQGDTQAVWGEGLNYQTPGAIWYTNGR